MVLGLMLAHSRTTGKVPVEIGGLTALKELDLSDNQLTGESYEPAAARITIYGARTNARPPRTTGMVPVEIGGLEHLEDLDLDSNKGLTGPTDLEDLQAAWKAQQDA